MNNSSDPSHQENIVIKSDNNGPSLLAHRRGVNPITVIVSVRANQDVFFKKETDPRIEESEESEKSEKSEKSQVRQA